MTRTRSASAGVCGGRAMLWMVLALAVATSASCGDGGTVTARASSEFTDAVVRMTSLRSVRMVGKATGPDTTDDIVTTDYQAPDRLHITQRGSEQHESFQIGSTLFQEDVGRPGYFRTVSLPADGATAQAAVFGLLDAMKRGGPVKEGATFRLALPDGGAMAATIRDGYIAQLTTTDARGVRRVQQYSQFNTAPAVVEPAVDRVLGPVPSAPKCANGKPPPSAFICTS